MQLAKLICTEIISRNLTNKEIIMSISWWKIMAVQKSFRARRGKNLRGKISNSPNFQYMGLPNPQKVSH